MKRLLIYLFVIASIKANAQTLHTVTNNGNTTTNTIKIQRPTSKIDDHAVSEFTGVEFNSTLWGTGTQNYLQLLNPNATTFRFAADYDGHGTGGTLSDIQFGTNSNAYLHIQNYGGSAGNIGIGTTSPLNKLHVNGILRWGSESSKSIYSGIDAQGAYIEQVGQDAAESKMRFQTSRSGDAINYSRLMIDPENGFLFQKIGTANGNVGIGTGTPGQKLDVDGSVNIRQYAYFKNAGTADYPNSFLHRLRAEDGYLYIDGDAGSSTYLPAISIHRQGNVGIGTATPNEKLAVNGKIRAKEIKVEATNWPDYVFAEGYKVGTLEELESYIKANKRLPEMPSAKEVEADGLQLGEMVKLQQKKIEELTLHLIEKDKELKNANNRLIQLEKENKATYQLLESVLNKINKLENK